jgi:hypothetical protein
MKRPEIGMQSLLQVSSALVILGLIVEVITLEWFHPLAFVLFAFVGVSLIGLGILVYLASLLFSVITPAENRG